MIEFVGNGHRPQNDNKYSYPMMNRAPFRNYQVMNLVHRTKDGNQLWLGDYYAASDVSLLRQKNIRSVLTSAAMLGICYQKQHEINHKTINALDIPSYRMTPHFQQAYHFIANALAKGHILVHCAAGISRSTTFVLVYLMRNDGMTFKQALEYVRNKRSIICPNYGFQNQLKRYELALKKTKQEKKQKKQPSLANYSDFSERKVVFDFVSDERKTPKRQEKKMNYTVGGSKGINNSTYVSSYGGSFNDPSGFLRGKSVNYATKKRNIDLTPDFKTAQKHTRPYLGHKMEAPKIITIRK